MNVLSALAHRHFRVYWMGQSVSLVGNWMQQVALGWVVVKLTGSATAIASVAFATSLPVLLFTLKGGQVADGRDRRKLLLGTQSALAACAAAYAVLLAADRISLAAVYTIALAAGAATAFDLPAQRAFVARLVPAAALPQAIAWNQAAFHGSRFVGPAAAAVLLSVAPLAAPFAANALSYIAAIASLLLLRGAARADGPRLHPRPGIGGGLGYLAARPELAALLGVTGLVATFVLPVLIVFMPVAVEELYGGEAWALGMLTASSGLGALAGSLALLRVPERARGRAIAVACATAAGALALITVVESPFAAAPFVTAIGLSVSIAVGLATTSIQVSIPDEIRGRVMSVHTLLMIGAMPSAALAWGALADVAGLVPTVRSMALGFAALSLGWIWRSGIARAASQAPG